MAGGETGEHYDAYYFAHCCGVPYERNEHWLGFFGGIGKRIVDEICPGSVLDAGCAMGFLVEELRNRGVDAYGLDASEYAIRRVHPSVKPYVWRGSVTEQLPQRYDLIVCIEVLEHLRPADAEKAIANFCQHADDVLFSSTPFDYKEATHINVQPPEYWAELFARHGLFHDLDFDASFITPWTARFRPRDKILHRIVRDYERRLWLLWKENTDLRSLTGEMRDQLATNEPDMDSLRKELAASAREAQEVREEMERIRGSRSWRVAGVLYNLRHRFAPEGSAMDRWLFGRR